MYNIKKADRFDGIIGIMNEEEFNKIIGCLELTLSTLKNSDCQKLLGNCKRALNSLTTGGYFDLKNREVHVHLSYGELSAITEAVCIHALSKIPALENGRYWNFDKCLENPCVKYWYERKEEE